MARFTGLTRLLAAAALALTLATPIASAQHHHGAHGHKGHVTHGHRAHRGHHGFHGKRDFGYRHHGLRGHRSYRGDRLHHAPRHHGHARGYYKPRHHAYRAPRYRHNGHFRGGRHGHYKPRYHVGGHYHRHERTVIVRNYSDYGLYHPPHGYHWVHDHGSGDAVLTSVATGAIIGLVVGAIVYD